MSQQPASLSPEGERFVQRLRVLDRDGALSPDAFSKALRETLEEARRELEPRAPTPLADYQEAILRMLVEERQR